MSANKHWFIIMIFCGGLKTCVFTIIDPIIILIIVGREWRMVGGHMFANYLGLD